jgi:hypothetical protein
VLSCDSDRPTTREDLRYFAGEDTQPKLVRDLEGRDNLLGVPVRTHREDALSEQAAIVILAFGLRIW